MNKFKTRVARILALSALACGSAMAADINVEINGIAETKGDVLVALYNKTEGWLKKGVSATKVSAQTGTVKVSFADLPPGEYAVSAVHDVNSNGKLDSNAIGIPSEPFGFSNDASGNFGPPSFDQAKFKLDTDRKTIAIKLN